MGIQISPANYQAIDGILWGWAWQWNTPDNHAVLTYSFPTSRQVYLDQGYADVQGFEAFNATQTFAATKVLANYDAVCNLDFVLTADSYQGNIRFAEASYFDDGNGFKNVNDTAFGFAPDNALIAPWTQGDTWYNNPDVAAGDFRPYIENATGGKGHDTITGNELKNVLSGGPGNDVISGLAGNDTLIGSSGRDKLTGGTGRDLFDFNSLSHSRPGSSHDTITDFKHGNNVTGDDIDLRDIDARSGVKGNQSFKWIGKTAFHDKKGELHYKDLGSKCLVSGDVNGDGNADFEILVKVGSLSSGDFLL